jgi:hypothetical protein
LISWHYAIIDIIDISHAITFITPLPLRHYYCHYWYCFTHYYAIIAIIIDITILITLLFIDAIRYWYIILLHYAFITITLSWYCIDYADYWCHIIDIDIIDIDITPLIDIITLLPLLPLTLLITTLRWYCHYWLLLIIITLRHWFIISLLIISLICWYIDYWHFDAIDITLIDIATLLIRHYAIDIDYAISWLLIIDISPHWHFALRHWHYYWYFISFDSRQRHYAITPDILTLRHFID